MSKFTPDYDEINALEAGMLQNRWQAIRYALDHRGEKGSAAEYEVAELIRSFLPNEYGLATGFIIYHETDAFIVSRSAPDPKISKQLDIIIYDTLKCSPLIRLGSCDVVPIEAVYAYVEIKGCLYKSQIPGLVEDANTLRGLKTRLYYKPKGSTGAEIAIAGINTLSIRSFIICLAAEESLDMEIIRATLEQECRRVGMDSFISGMLVIGRGFYYSHSVSAEKPEDIENKYKVYLKSNKPLSDFKWCMIESLSRFHRIPTNCTPALDTYSKEFRADIEYPRASGTLWAFAP